MLRLSLLLCIAMYAALMTLGEDRGQMRPGLAQAAAEGRAAPAADPVQLAEVTPEPAPQPAPDPAPQPLAEAAPLPAPLAAEPVDLATDREVVTVLEEPVFSLATLGNEPIPGEDGTPLPQPDVAQDAPETPADTPQGTIWYVNASSVNVRAAPSTEAEILDRLGTGDAALLVEQIDAEWARIVIQGDGLEGYVALRFLTPAAP